VCAPENENMVDYSIISMIKTFLQWNHKTKWKANPVVHSVLSQKLYTNKPVFPLDMVPDTHSILLLNIRKEQNQIHEEGLP